MIPPLRERKGDIALLAGHFLHEHSRKSGLTPKKFSKEVLPVLEEYYWPGNMLDDDSSPPPATQLKLSLEEVKIQAERRHIVAVLKDSNGNISNAAKRLGIDRNYLHRRIQVLAIKKKELF